MRRLVPVVIVLLVVAGCGPKPSKTGAIKGTLTYKGQPVNDATLTLNPAGETKNSVVFVHADPEGKFFAVDVAPGEYKITVEGSTGTSGIPDSRRKDSSKWTPEMKAKLESMKTKPTIPFPAKYKKSHTSDLKCTVSGGEQTLDLVLKD
jgi:hypothetical protein